MWKDNKGQDVNKNYIEIELSSEDYNKLMNLDEFDIERKMLQTSAAQYIRISLRPERLSEMAPKGDAIV